MVGFGEREGEVRVNFGESKFIYDIDAHDWTVEETAATLRARALDSGLSDVSLLSPAFSPANSVLTIGRTRSVGEFLESRKGH